MELCTKPCFFCRQPKLFKMYVTQDYNVFFITEYSCNKYILSRVLVIRVYNYSCQNNVNCQVFGPDGICESRSCVCNKNSHFVQSEQFCWVKKGLNETCQQDIDCYIDGVNGTLSCTNNICSCPHGTHANSDYTDCLENYIGNILYFYSEFIIPFRLF